MRIAACTIVLCLIGLYGYSSNPSLTYINKYRDVAIDEMNASGIPASIKLAQALLESGAGKSTLAKEANNHFGIKCGGSWHGDTYYRKDDDYNNKGQLIESCFRQFSSPRESFRAHTEFLTTQPRYEFLFSYSYTDYTGWAYGLRKAGYATDKAYPKKLIDLIDKYKLYEYDRGYVSEPIAEHLPSTDRKTKKRNTNSKTKNSRDYTVNKKSERRSRSKSDKRTNSKRSSKRKSSSNKYHIVEADESMADIAQAYRIKENKLRLRNRLPKDAQPKAGEKIYLKKKISLLQRPKFVRVPDNNALASSEYIF